MKIQLKIFGIQNKGFIKEGFDADFTIVDMNKTIEIKNENIESKCGWTPFDGPQQLNLRWGSYQH